MGKTRRDIQSSASSLSQVSIMWVKLCVVLAVICFIEVNTKNMTLFRLIQGSPITIDTYPVMAQLLLDIWGTNQYEQHCAGVILTSRHVLSAAHCFQYNGYTMKNYSMPNFWKVRVGSSYRTKGGFLYNVESIIPHERYDGFYFSNDIAIVLVSKKFHLTNNVRQATIIKQGIEIEPTSSCRLIGWGVLSPNGEQPEQLQQAVVTIMDSKICQERYNTIGAAILDSMLCTGRLNSIEPDACFGDSGGPLIYKGIVVGIVSFGYSCGNSYFPGVYTKISYFTNWVTSIVNSKK